MKKMNIRGLIALLLASVMLFSVACTAGEKPTETNSHADPDIRPSTGGALTENTDVPTEAPADASVNTETAAPDEPDEPVPEIVIPEGNPPSLEALLKGEAVLLSQDWNFANASLGSLKTNGVFVSTGGSLFKSSAKGLIADNTAWDALGFASPVSTDTYTAEVELYVYPNDRGGSFNAAMVGLFCKTAENLFIDGGLWFSFRDNQVSAYVKQGFEKVIQNDLPFSAADGIHFKAEGNRKKVTIYANDFLIATVAITAEGILLQNAQGKEVAATDLTHLSVDGTGYFRYMTHYANSMVSSMKLTGETQRAYTPADTVFSFQTNTPYAFVDKAQYLSNAPTAIHGGLLYADGETLAEMFGFTSVVDNDTLILTRDDVTLTFTAGAPEIKINGEAYGFPTAVKTKNGFILAAEKLAQMMGYDQKTSDDLTILATSKNITKEALRMAQERFDLYKDIIYNYDDVECDQTGVDRVTPVPYAERLVGIAYTTWHRPATKWGDTHTWDLPLYGAYSSDDEKVIRRHGEQLRDAGVDFVFVDWSNNTEYDPVTMREHRADFRMIEEATDKLFDVWATIEGAPKICIFVGPGHNGPKTIESGDHQRKVDQVWRDYVTNPDRADMYFHYDGKPLLICYGATPTMYGARPSSMWDDNRFTVRWMTGYVGQQGGLFRSATLQSLGYWSWEERGAQTYTVHNGMVEAVTVTAATRKQASEGEEGYIPEAGRQNGFTFKKQVQRACDLGARIMLIVSWNEWTTSEQPSIEVSKDMEPSVTYGTFYLDLMREQIKKFKGKIEKN
ncbi:MAG: hypothetical protein E7645_08580 [Ruminococcaceae bacterium]|nr:hypothetical protein [Oscillospiraceae bacterium]